MNRKEIKGFPDYTITEEGWVLHHNKPMKIQVNKNNTPFIRLRKYGEYHTFTIAKLVALTYLTDTRKTPSDVVCYKDGNNHNFNRSNLYWSSRSEAYSKLYEKGNRYSENRLINLRKTLCKPVVALNKEKDGFSIVKQYTSITEAANAVGVAPASLTRCLKNKRYMSAGFHWAYVPKEDE